jgi:hypothetical protein
MAGQAATDWEDILNAYLEGRGLRADAEDLLMRLHLRPQDREQIERSLRLSDEITGALRPIQPPAGMETRVAEQLRACAAPAVPGDWNLTGKSKGAAKDAGGEDDLLDAALEGRVAVEELYAMQSGGQLSEAGREALEEFEFLAAGVAEVSVPMGGAAPAGMEARLRDGLREYMSSEAGDIDARLANRLLAKKPTRGRGRQFTMPDVLAAGDEKADGDAPGK